ncbi:MAG: thiamine pyrophosphate-dependent enzyme [Hyphomicrobiaceae bacterium]
MSLVKRFETIATRVREAEDPLYDALLATIGSALDAPILVGDSTKPAYRATLTYRAARPRGFFSAATGFGTLGFALPAAIGAKIACPDRHVVAMTGDGGIQFTLPELMSAKEAGAGIIVLVWNNEGYREIRDHMVRKEIEPIAVDVGPPSFMKTAEAVGIPGVRVGSMDELSGLLRARDPASREPLMIEAGPWMKA